MNHPYFVFTIIALVAIAMATNKVRYDFIAIMVVLVVTLSGLLSVQESFAGFGHPVVILVACLLIVGEMLDKTGIAARVGEKILQFGGSSQKALVALLMFGAAILSSVMSSTAVVAIFIPIVFRIAERSGIIRSELLMPVAYAALISGMITLIATPPNLVINDALVALDGSGLSFFSFAPLGILVLVISVLYFCYFKGGLPGKNQICQKSSSNHKSLRQMWSEFNIDEQIKTLEINPHSELIDSPLSETFINTRFGVRVLAVVSYNRGKESIRPVDPQLVLSAKDILVVTGTESACESLCTTSNLTELGHTQEETQKWLWEVGASLVLIHPESTIVNQSVTESTFRSRFGAQIMAIKRDGEIINDILKTRFKRGDVLFVVGTWKKLEKLNNESRELILLESPQELNLYKPNAHKATTAFVIIMAMVSLKLFNVVPITIAAMLAVLAAILTRCLSVQEAYRSVNWSSLVLIAGMLPLATALEKSGGTRLIVNTLLNTIGDSSVYTLLSVLFVITTLFTLVLSNTASAVLMTPIAIGMASSIGVSPYPLAIAVLMGASAAFASPVSTPVVTLVVEPGNYRFLDFVRSGLPLTVITGLITVLLTPLLFPF